jgi:thymidine kinase
MTDKHQLNKEGSLNLIIGPMFSGKSTRLIQYIRSYKILGFPIIVVKPSLDKRYTELNEICTHNYDKESCMCYDKDCLNDIFKNNDYKKSNIIIIEEGQFFSNLFNIVKKMTDIDKKVVYVTGLNGDSNRELFGEIYKLMPLADNIELLHALCMDCKDGTNAIYSKRIVSDNNQILIDGKKSYKAVCRKHFLKK